MCFATKVKEMMHGIQESHLWYEKGRSLLRPLKKLGGKNWSDYGDPCKVLWVKSQMSWKPCRAPLYLFFAVAWSWIIWPKLHQAFIISQAPSLHVVLDFWRFVGAYFNSSLVKSGVHALGLLAELAKTGTTCVTTVHAYATNLYSLNLSSLDIPEGSAYLWFFIVWVQMSTGSKCLYFLLPTWELSRSLWRRRSWCRKNVDSNICPCLPMST